MLIDQRGEELYRESREKCGDRREVGAGGGQSMQFGEFVEIYVRVFLGINDYDNGRRSLSGLAGPPRRRS
jgi:hypothetical protein